MPLLAWFVSLVVLVLSAPIPLVASAAPVLQAASPDGRIDLSVSSSATTITTPGSAVTWTYTVVNRSASPVYQTSITDTECGPITGK